MREGLRREKVTKTEAKGKKRIRNEMEEGEGGAQRRAIISWHQKKKTPHVP